MAAVPAGKLEAGVWPDVVGQVLSSTFFKVIYQRQFQLTINYDYLITIQKSFKLIINQLWA